MDNHMGNNQPTTNFDLMQFRSQMNPGEVNPNLQSPLMNFDKFSIQNF